MRTDEEIARLYTNRVRDRQTALDEMWLFQCYISGQLEIQIEELDTNERSAIANLAKQGLEQYGLRVASTMPSPHWASVRPGFKEHDDRARTRKMASLGWWEHNDMEEIMTLRAMDLFAYGASPCSVLPDPSSGIPMWQKHDPLTVFSAPCANPVDVVRRDSIISSETTYGWLVDTYGSAAKSLGGPHRQNALKNDDPVLTLRYVDKHEIVLIATATSSRTTRLAAQGQQQTWKRPNVAAAGWTRLEHMKNKAGCPLVFEPEWQTIVGARGRFNGTIGAHQMRAKLLALAYLTATRGAMPEEWIDPMQADVEPEVLNYPDPQTGEPGRIRNGTLKYIQTNPGFMTAPMMSTLERENRLEAGIPADFGGESASTVRTGRRGDSILASTIDFPIQRAQRRLARSLTCETKAAVHIVKNWTPGPRSFYVSWKGASGQVDYDPAKDFDSDQVKVTYALAGSDLNNDILRAQSKVGTGLWSKKMAREMDPETPDAERAHDEIVAEQIEETALGLFTQQVADGTLNVDDLHAFYEAIRKDRSEVVDALKAAHDKAKERQAEAATQAPEQMPGLAAPPPTVAEPPEGLENMSRTKFLLSSIAGGNAA